MSSSHNAQLAFTPEVCLTPKAMLLLHVVPGWIAPYCCLLPSGSTALMLVPLLLLLLLLANVLGSCC
jgi:hypothetical protein